MSAIVDNDTLLVESNRIIDGLRLTTRKRRSMEFRAELHSRISISLSDPIEESGLGETSARQLVAYCLIDLVSLGDDCGGYYDAPRECLQADNQWGHYLDWQSQLREAKRLLAGEFSAEYAENVRINLEIDRQFA